MEWPTGCQVPGYFVRGMTFESLLDAHRDFVDRINERGFPGSTRMEDDEELAPRRLIRALAVNKKQESGIRKKKSAILKSRASFETEKPLTAYSSRRPSVRSVKVRNIPYSTSEDELRDHFCRA